VSVHVDTTTHFLLAQYFHQVSTRAITTYSTFTWRESACRYDCTFLWLIVWYRSLGCDAVRLGR